MSEKDIKQEETIEETKQNDQENLEEEKQEDPVTLLQQEIDALQAQVATLKNDYARAYADTENTRKRLTADFEQRSKYQMANFMSELLPILDNCERALQQPTTDEAYRKGVEMILTQLKYAMEKEGVKEIDALDQPFDGNFHQALMSEKVEGKQPNTVVAVLQKGYLLKDRLLRAAMVKVSE